MENRGDREPNNCPENAEKHCAEFLRNNPRRCVPIKPKVSVAVADRQDK